MADTNFCCRSGGSNLNAGTRTGNTTVPGTSADFTYASGSWVSGTGVFTPASGNPQSDGVAVGDFVSIYDQNNSLRTKGITNSYARTPDHADLDITGDLDIRAKVRMDDWTPSAEVVFVSKWTSGQRAYEFGLKTTGTLHLRASADGINATVDQSSNVAISFTDGFTGWIRVTLDADNGAAGKTIAFYTSTDGITWTQLGTSIILAGTITIFSGTSITTVNQRNDFASLGAVGNLYSVEIRNGIDGTIVANPDFSAQSAGTTSFPDTAGTPKTWTVGSAASITAPTTTGFVARITAVSTTTFTASLTAKSGGVPNTGSGFYTAKVGGAWLGPNGYDGFPHNWIQNTLTNAAGDYPWIHDKSDQTHTMNAAVVKVNNVGPIGFSGFTTTYLDGGEASYAGVAASGSFSLWEFTNSNGTLEIESILFNGNGSASNAGLVNASNNNARLVIRKCRFTGGRGNGFSGAGGNGFIEFTECEFYGNGLSNTAANGGLAITGAASINRCIFRDNTGSNISGVILNGSNVVFTDCEIESNGQFGISHIGGNRVVVRGTEFWNNVSDGIRLAVSTSINVDIEDCNFFKNGGYGINRTAAGAYIGTIRNCSFGAGTQANTSGATNNLGRLREVGSVVYPANEHPWMDPANGDFRLVHQYAMATGSGTFPGSITVGSPDRGAAQARRSFRTVGNGGLAG